MKIIDFVTYFVLFIVSSFLLKADVNHLLHFVGFVGMTYASVLMFLWLYKYHWTLS